MPIQEMLGCGKGLPREEVFVLLNELLEMLDGDEDRERGCCQQRQPRAKGVRGFITALLSGGDDDDDDDSDRGNNGRCCSGVTRDGNAREPDGADRRRDRDERNNDFDFGD